MKERYMILARNSESPKNWLALIDSVAKGNILSSDSYENEK